MRMSIIMNMTGDAAGAAGAAAADDDDDDDEDEEGYEDAHYHEHD